MEITKTRRGQGICFNGISEFIPVKIKCPECGKICNAEIETNDFPFAVYIHTCEHCGHIIQEDEWEEIKKEELCITKE
jgi:hypothetical protein